MTATASAVTELMARGLLSRAAEATRQEREGHTVTWPPKRRRAVGWLKPCCGYRGYRVVLALPERLREAGVVRSILAFHGDSGSAPSPPDRRLIEPRAPAPRDHGRRR